MPAELYHGVRYAAGAWIGEAHRFHGAEPEGFRPTAGGLFNGETALEVGDLIEVMALVLVGGHQGFDERPVLRLRHRRVEVVVPVTLAVA